MESNKQNYLHHLKINKSTIANSIQISNTSRKLLCIVYPGIVNNVDKMIETLGGIKDIELASSDPTSKVLELRFRPDDLYCKPCRADKDYKKGLLMKITVRQPKKNVDLPSTSKVSSTDVEKQATYKYELVGVTTVNFTFNRLCDFQYLPLIPTDENETKNTPCRDVSKQIMPDGLPRYEWFLSKESYSVPLFFPPPCYVKPHSMKNAKLHYEKHECYENVLPEFAKRLKKEFLKHQQNATSMISNSRVPRKFYSQLVNFNHKNLIIPTIPHQGALKNVQDRCSESDIKIVEKLFEERPIWPKLALLHKSGIRDAYLKSMLPCLAYYCKNGPWRALWVKLGYDPRQDPASHIYQSIDFRVSRDELKTIVQARRSFSTINFRTNEIARSKFSLNDAASLKRRDNQKVIEENNYIMKSDVLPPARQVFYQFCDIHIDEIQEMINRLPRKSSYTTKNGWFPAGFQDQCREILMNHVTNLVKTKLLEEKQETEETESEEMPNFSKTTNEDDCIIVSDEDEEQLKKMNEPEDEDETDEEDANIDKILEEVEKIVGTKSKGDEDDSNDDDEEFESLYREILSSNQKYL